MEKWREIHNEGIAQGWRAGKQNAAQAVTRDRDESDFELLFTHNLLFLWSFFSNKFFFSRSVICTLLE
jgi:hypothetical protein